MPYAGPGGLRHATATTVDLPPAPSYLACHARTLDLLRHAPCSRLPSFHPLPPWAPRHGSSWTLWRQRLRARIDPVSMVRLWLREISVSLLNPQRRMARVMAVACGLYILLTTRPGLIDLADLPPGGD